jgi:signal transduction histidine kinase
VTDAWTQIRRYPWRLIFLLSNAVGVLLFFYKTLEDVASRNPVDWQGALLEEVTGSYAAFVLIPFVIWLVLRRPVREGGWRRQWPMYLGAGVLFGVAQTTLMYVFRLAAFAAAGRGVYDYGILPVRYLMELPQELISFTVIVVVVSYSEDRRLAHEREIQMRTIERQLAEAQLEALQLQLRPHFLFNALNAISEMVYEDAAKADRMIGRLSEFLRQVLRAHGRNETPLRDELALLELYLDIMRARFEDKLECSVEVGENLERALVPQLVLQPVVENAVRYGSDPVTGRVRIAVRAHRVNGRLSLEVEDGGAGLQDDANGHGLGLKNLAARLEGLYGSAGTLTIAHRPGGTRVSISVPYLDESGAATE